nr:14756_t:CDS:2 [Entrophospora candida]
MVVKRFIACGPVLLANPYFLYNIRITLKYTISSITYSSSLSTFYPKRSLYNFNKNLTTTTPNAGLNESDIKLTLMTKLRQELVKIQSQMPSMLQMARLATDGQVKQKLINLNNEFKNAGVEFNAETAQKYITLDEAETDIKQSPDK